VGKEGKKVIGLEEYGTRHAKAARAGKRSGTIVLRRHGLKSRGG